MNEMSPDQHASVMPGSPMLLYPEGAAIQTRPEPGCFIYNKVITSLCTLCQVSHLPQYPVLMMVALQQLLEAVGVNP